jgi:hypothetical protein
MMPRPRSIRIEWSLKLTNQEKWDEALTGINKYRFIRLLFDKKITDEAIKQKLEKRWRELNPEQQNPLEMALDPEWWNVEPPKQLHL